MNTGDVLLSKLQRRVWHAHEILYKSSPYKLNKLWWLFFFYHNCLTLNNTNKCHPLLPCQALTGYFLNAKSCSVISPVCNSLPWNIFRNRCYELNISKLNKASWKMVNMFWITSMCVLKPQAVLPHMSHSHSSSCFHNRTKSRAHDKKNR